MIWNVIQATWLPYFQLKFKNGLYVQKVLAAILLAIIKGILNLTPQGMQSLKGTNNSPTSGMAKGILPQMITSKNWLVTSNN